MTTDEIFEVIEVSDTQVHVRHIGEKHFYTYAIDEDTEGSPHLSEQPVYVIEVADTATSAVSLYDDARAFAEKEALAYLARKSEPSMGAHEKGAGEG
jgi:hypothetical protein